MRTFDWPKLKIPAIIFIMLFGIIGRAEKVEFRYWFNQDSDNAETVVYSSATGSITIPFHAGQSGRMNVLNIQVKDSTGLWSVPYRSSFYPPTDGKLHLAYSIDNSEFRNLEEDKIDISDIHPGVHRLCIINRNMPIPPSCALIYKNPTSKQNLKLTLSSVKNSLKKETAISSFDNECLIDVRNLSPGIYPVNVTIADTSTHTLVALANANVEIGVPYGNRLTSIYYWLNDSIGSSRKFELQDANLPISKSVNIPLAAWNVPSLDYYLSLDNDGRPFIAPKYGITLSFRNNYGFAIDSTSLITDNSRLVELHATQLNGSVQYDEDKWRTDSCYWYKFKAIAGDNISLSTRLRCKVKLYSPSAELVETATFNFDKMEMSKPLDETGVYYVQLSEIDQSRQEFSVLLTYLSGPSVNNHNQSEPTYEGIPIEWKSASDWVSEDHLISYMTKGIKMIVDGDGAQYQPYVADKSRLCRVYSHNTIRFSTGGYIEKVTLCLPNIPNYLFPRITTPSGTVSVDSLANIVVWTGFSKIAEIKIEDKADDAVLPLTKAFVKVSDLTENEICILDNLDEISDMYYTPFNIVRLWRQGEDKQEASYLIGSDTKITFDGDELVIATDNKEYRHSTANKLILTFDYDPQASIDEAVTPNNSPQVTVDGNNICITGLPDMVGIYSMAGFTYYQNYVDNNEFNYSLSNLQPGIYIIVVGKKRIKILIP